MSCYYIQNRVYYLCMQISNYCANLKKVGLFANHMSSTVCTFKLKQLGSFLLTVHIPFTAIWSLC